MSRRSGGEPIHTLRVDRSAHQAVRAASSPELRRAIAFEYNSNCRPTVWINSSGARVATVSSRPGKDREQP